MVFTPPTDGDGVAVTVNEDGVILLDQLTTIEFVADIDVIRGVEEIAGDDIAVVPVDAATVVGDGLPY